MRNSPETKKINEHIGMHIKGLRVERGWTRLQLAKKIGVSHQQLRKYELGTDRVSACRLVVIARALERRLEEFCGEDIDYVPEINTRLSIENMKLFTPLTLQQKVAHINFMRAYR